MSSLLKSSLSKKNSLKGKGEEKQRVKLSPSGHSKEESSGNRSTSLLNVAEEESSPGHENNSKKDFSGNINDGTKEFRQNMNAEAETLFDDLRDNLIAMEFRTKASGLQALEKDNLAFFEKLDATSLRKLHMRQMRELERIKTEFKNVFNARESRKRDLMQQFNLNAAAENHDITIQELDESQAVSLEIKEMIDDYRAAFEQLLRHIDAQHTKIRKQLSAAQERRIQDKKTLIELETKNLGEELRLSRMKKFQFQINHQKMIDKKVSEHFRAAQMLEIRQTKELFDLELKLLEKLQFLKVQNSQKVAETSKKQRKELQDVEKSIKEMEFDYNTNMLMQHHQDEISRLKTRHRAEQKIMKEKQTLRQTDRTEKWASKLAKIKEAMENNEKEMNTADVDPPESLGICELSFALTDLGDEPLPSEDIDHSSNSVVTNGDSNIENKMGSAEHVVFQDPQLLQDQNFDFKPKKTYSSFQEETTR
ncbi:hypothetical protein HMI54_005305 [Coelomomyces lativittatus]|nr:hypothetical protein HMI54_005305 [Coelomomyces lativittatus]